MQSLFSSAPDFKYPITNSFDSYQPFFIVGSGRSGNTLLRRILNTHQDVHIPPETYVLEKVIKNFKKSQNMRWEDIVHFTLSKFEFHPEFETFQVSLRPLACQLLETPKERRSLAFILNSFYLYHANQSHKKPIHWGDKTPYNIFFLDDILEVFPQGKFIHIIRDGCDVIPSYVKAGRYKDIVSAAWRWRKSIESAERFSAKNPGVCLEIRYESLVKKPEVVAKELCAFLNLNYQAEILEIQETVWNMGDVSMRSHHQNVFRPISCSSIGKGRGELTMQERARIKEIINPHLIRYGYEPC